MPIEARYTCTGGCGGWVREADFNAGKQTCGTQGCPKTGQLFAKMMYCTECGGYFDAGTPHSHEQKKSGFFSWLPWMK